MLILQLLYCAVSYCTYIHILCQHRVHNYICTWCNNNVIKGHNINSVCKNVLHCTFIWYYPHKGHEPLLYVLTDNWSSLHELISRKVIILGHMTSESHRKSTEIHTVLCKCITHVSMCIAHAVSESIHFVWCVYIFCKPQPLPQSTVKTKHINAISLLLSPLCPAPFLSVTPMP